ncbi:stromelysin-2-like isoform X2 [Chiloscyllium plagiosum]|uniref:stromelysin-2-like isoform X2 n=1 Tax=Chiloscyllium plagiosum TaxID=36176 RepID=UPI001CB7DDC2|nr:stromelysin-2-like isoform X2 [Chiloscyllium plagiosum]
MKTMFLYLLAFQIGLMSFLSAGLPLSTVQSSKRGTEETRKTYHLKITRSLVNGTMGLHKGPRCGVAVTKGVKVIPHQYIFEKHNITYSVKEYTTDLPRRVVDEVLKRAFKLWSDVTTLSFTKTTAAADIEISFGAGDHGDAFPFHGHGHVLAHAFPPGPGIGGDAHFDEAETWVTGSNGPPVMTTQMLGQMPTQKQTPGQSPTQIPGQTSTKEALMSDPDVFMDAAVKINRTVLFFKNGFYKTAGSSKITPVNNTWPSITSNIDAAVEYSRSPQRRNDVVFFTGHQYWHYTGDVLKPGFPKNISELGFPDTVKQIDAAMRVKLHWIMFFVGDQYWSYNLDENQMSSRSPRLITDTFSNLSKVDAAVEHFGTYYLTSGPLIYGYRGMEVRKILKRHG